MHKGIAVGGIDILKLCQSHNDGGTPISLRTRRKHLKKHPAASALVLALHHGTKEVARPFVFQEFGLATTVGSTLTEWEDDSSMNQQ